MLSMKMPSTLFIMMANIILCCVMSQHQAMKVFSLHVDYMNEIKNFDRNYTAVAKK